MRLCVPTFLALLAATPLAAQPVTPPTRVMLTAEAKVERAPDLAEMTAGVVTQAPTAAAAIAANAERMTAVIAALGRAAVARRDIQTAGLGLQPQYDYQERKAPQLTGYQATNSVRVQLRDLARAGAVIDALVAAGANQVDGPSFSLEDEDRPLDAARTAAVAKARARAELYARALGMRVRRIVTLSESGAVQPPMPRPMARMMVAESAPATPVAPGMVTLSAAVTLEVELE